MIVARVHSKYMLARRYFAQLNPEGKDPFERMKEAKLKFMNDGENLNLAQILQIAHMNLMNVPCDRAIIINPSFGHVGICIQDGGLYGLMISQEFRD